MLPTVGVSAGMILTEMPAALFMVAALWLLGKIIADKTWQPLSIPAALVCGLMMAAAVLGRQNYIVILPCLLLAVRWRSGAPNRRDTVRMALIGAVVLLVAGPVFLLWGGFIPPHDATGWRPAVPGHSIGSLVRIQMRERESGCSHSPPGAFADVRARRRRSM